MRRDLIIKLFAPVLVVMVLFSCDDGSDNLDKEKELRLLKQYLEANNITVEPESSGLYYIPSAEGGGTSPGINDWVVIRYTARLINDRIFDTTDESTAVSNNIYSSSVLYGDKRMEIQQMGLMGVREGLSLMKEGGQATLIIPSFIGYGSEGMGSVPGYTTLVYDIELVKVISDAEAYEQQMIDEYIAGYADSAHLTVEKRESGMYYIEVLEGTGEGFNDESEKASVYYTGALTDGRVFDSNIGGNPFIFDLGGNETIPGFEEGVKLLKLEGRSRIVLPSSIAYGEEGSGDKIPGYTPLVFDLRLVDIQ